MRLTAVCKDATMNAPATMHIHKTGCPDAAWSGAGAAVGGTLALVHFSAANRNEATTRAWESWAAPARPWRTIFAPCCADLGGEPQ